MRRRLLACCLWAICFTAFTVQSTLAPADLRCEYLKDPQGIDTPQPRLSWILDSRSRQERGQRQTAYQILVAGSRERLATDKGDLWNSGKVESDQSIHVAYAGEPLASGQICFWKVRVWDQYGRVSAWSKPASWTIGLLSGADWEATWIGKDENETKPVLGGEVGIPGSRRLPARWLRKEFRIERDVRRATAYISGLGLSELYLNGQKVGDHVLSPGLTEYPRRVFYVTHDIAPLLKNGWNCVGVVLGNGRYYAPRTAVPTQTRNYGFPRLLLQISIEYDDGTTQKVLSDATWKMTTNGPIRANNEYDGEEYDARMGLDGWSLPGFSDSDWDTPQMVSAPGGMLVAQMIEPIRVVETLKPVSLSNPRPGVHIFDMGQNMVGWCRLRVAGPRGTAVTLRHAETLKSDGTLYLDNLRSAKVADTYILKGNVEEIYEPRFTYHGFRFVELRGYPGTPDLSSIEGRVVHDDLESSGTWTCSNPLLNRIYRNVLWGVRGNYRSIPTDCPQRDERQGWLGDRSAESRGETYLFRVDALYSKWLQDMADAQKESGSIPDVAPAYWPFYTDNVTWPSSTVIIPGHLVEQYADSGLLARHYPSMKKWVDFMAGFLKDDLMPRDTYGDWCVPPEDPKMIHSQDPMRRTAPTVIGTAYFYHSLGLMSRYAAQLGKTADAHRYGELASRLKEAFNRTFLNADASWYDNGTQTSSVLALAFDLVPGEHRQQIFNHLVDKITRESKGHIGTGLIGCQWLLRTLSNNGRADLAYTLASQKTYPSWGYMIEKGATTVWELWNGDTADPAMNSGNHLMLVGDLITWFYEYLAGIQPDPARPGFKHIIMCPHPVGDLQYVRATHRSPYGLIESDWRRERGVFFWNVTIPVNSTGTIYVPASSGAAVLEGKAPASRARGLSFLRQENGYVVFSAQSGRYSLTSR